MNELINRLEIETKSIVDSIKGYNLEYDKLLRVRYRFRS